MRFEATAWSGLEVNLKIESSVFNKSLHPTEYSSTCSVKYGKPQGSCLRPLLGSSSNRYITFHLMCV